MPLDDKTTASNFFPRPALLPNQIRKIIKRVVRTSVFRTVLFLLLLAIHCFRRLGESSITRSEHRLTPWKFAFVSLTRLQRGIGAHAQPYCQTYICQRGREGKSLPHFALWAKAPWYCAWLYFANVQKIQGFFDDAEFVYLWLVEKQAVRGAALRGLGDLFTMQATWAAEFHRYGEIGVAINPFKLSTKYSDVRMWQDRTFKQAVDILTEAVKVDAENIDGWWLLAYACERSGLLQKALEADAECAARGPVTFEERFSHASRMFAIDPTKGKALYETALESWLGWWRVLDVQVVPAALLAEHSNISYIELGKAFSTPIESHVIRDGEIIPIRSSLTFDASYVAQYEHAEIIPQFGMILANREYLISDSAHVHSCHFPLFTDAIRSTYEGRALIAGRMPMPYSSPGCIYIGHNNNYYHWLLDELPRLSLLSESGLHPNAPILVDVSAAAWQIQLLHRLGIDHSRVRSVDFSEPLSVKDLIVPSRLSANMVAHPSAVRFMRDRLVPHAASLTPRRGKRIYLSRGKHKGRAMLNEGRVLEKFRRAGFSVVDTSGMTIDQQMEFFADAEVIAGPGGAAITNTLFAPVATKVVMLSSSHALCHTFTSITSALGQESWMLNGLSYARPHPHWIWSMFDFEISERDIDLCFEQVL